MDSGGFTSNVIHEAKAAGVRKEHANQTGQGNKATAVHWAEWSEEHESVAADKKDRYYDQAQIMVDIFGDGDNETLDGLQMRGCVLEIDLP